VPRFNRRGSEKWERAGVERRREGREEVEGMTEGEEGRHGEFGWGNCAIAPRGDRRHCKQSKSLKTERVQAWMEYQPSSTKPEDQH